MGVYVVIYLENYNDWTDNQKTVILLNGGTTSEKIINGEYFGTLNKHREELIKNGIINSSFNEPDLGDQLTCVVFMVDERVFNSKDYPDFKDWIISEFGYDYLNFDIEKKNKPRSDGFT